MGNYKLKMFFEFWRLKAIIQWKMLSLFGVGRTYHEQRLWREYRCPDCVKNDKCDSCPCNLNGMMMSPNGRCSKRIEGVRKWTKMMSDKEWNEYKKKNGVRIFIIDKELEFQQGKKAADILAKEKMLESETRALSILQVEITQKIRDLQIKRKNLTELVTKKQVTVLNIKKELEQYENLVEEFEVDINRLKNTRPAGENEVVVSKEPLPGTSEKVMKIELESNTFIPKEEAESGSYELYADKQKAIHDDIDFKELYVGEKEDADGNSYAKRGKRYTYGLNYTGDLEIVSVEGSCGCQDLEWKGSLVTGTISITKKKEYVGMFMKEIYIYLKPDKQYYTRQRSGQLAPDNRNLCITVPLRYNIKE